MVSSRLRLLVPGNIANVDQNQRFGRAGAHAGRALLMLHRSRPRTATARTPGTQSSSVLTRAGAGGAGGAFWSVGISPEYAADGCRKSQSHRTGRLCRTACSSRTGFVQLYRAVNAVMAFTGQTPRARRIFTVVAELRGRLFFIT